MTERKTALDQSETSTLSKAERYERIRKEFSSVLESPSIPFESALVSLIAIYQEYFKDKINWVGFYRDKLGTLWVGPYQGKIACLSITSGRGVCGKSFAEQKTIVVPDVEEFPGHIACDSASRSEIVLPVFRRHGILKNCVGVFDIDSPLLAQFDDLDRRELENLLVLLEKLSD